tara:strand:- start:167 stop:586 length:420 start_codon:yes stop_codon:yes gene_type:complete
MKVEINSNIVDIGRKIDKKGKELRDSVKKALLITALQGINVIEDRTAKGRGLKGFFPKYSPQYAAFRISRGRKRNVDLQFTGNMLGSISAVSTSSYAEIYFMRSREAEKAAMVGKKRPFFGFSRNERAELAQVFFKALK